MAKRSMKLWLVGRVQKDSADWDQMEACVVAASGPVMARRLASEHAGDEGAAFWRSPGAYVRQIAENCAFDEPQLVLRSFRYG